ENIEQSIVVVITPCDRAIRDTGQQCWNARSLSGNQGSWRVNVNESAACISPNLRNYVGGGAASDDEIQPSVIIKIAPGHCAAGHTRQTRSNRIGYVRKSVSGIS